MSNGTPSRQVQGMALNKGVRLSATEETMEAGRQSVLSGSNLTDMMDIAGIVNGTRIVGRGHTRTCHGPPCTGHEVHGLHFAAAGCCMLNVACWMLDAGC